MEGRREGDIPREGKEEKGTDQAPIGPISITLRTPYGDGDGDGMLVVWSTVSARCPRTETSN